MTDLRDALDEFYQQMHTAPRRSGGRGGARVGIKPHASEALAVHPDQREEAMALDRKLGVPTEYLPNGQPIMRSRAHQKEWIRAHRREGAGYFNKDGGYGD